MPSIKTSKRWLYEYNAHWRTQKNDVRRWFTKHKRNGHVRNWMPERGCPKGKRFVPGGVMSRLWEGDFGVYTADCRKLFWAGRIDPRSDEGTKRAGRNRSAMGRWPLADDGVLYGQHMCGRGGKIHWSGAASDGDAASWTDESLLCEGVWYQFESAESMEKTTQLRDENNSSDHPKKSIISQKLRRESEKTGENGRKREFDGWIQKKSKNFTKTCWQMFARGVQ